MIHDISTTCQYSCQLWPPKCTYQCSAAVFMSSIVLVKDGRMCSRVWCDAVIHSAMREISKVVHLMKNNDPKNIQTRQCHPNTTLTQPTTYCLINPSPSSSLLLMLKSAPNSRRLELIISNPKASCMLLT